MKCQIPFSGKNKKNISKCRLLKILPRVLRVKMSSAAVVTGVCCDQYTDCYRSSHLFNTIFSCTVDSRYLDLAYLK